MKKSIKDCITRMEMQRATKCLDAATAEHLTIEVIQTAGRHFERLTLNHVARTQPMILHNGRVNLDVVIPSVLKGMTQAYYLLIA